MNSLSAMHFLPQTRHGISDFDCFSYYTLTPVGTIAIDADLGLAADRHQQTLFSENHVNSFGVDSVPHKSH